MIEIKETFVISNEVEQRCTDKNNLDTIRIDVAGYQYARTDLGRQEEDEALYEPQKVIMFYHNSFLPSIRVCKKSCEGGTKYIVHGSINRVVKWMIICSLILLTVLQIVLIIEYKNGEVYLGPVLVPALLIGGISGGAVILPTLFLRSFCVKFKAELLNEKNNGCGLG